MRLPFAASLTFTGLGARGQASPNSVDSHNVASGTRSPILIMRRLLRAALRPGKQGVRRRAVKPRQTRPSPLRGQGPSVRDPAKSLAERALRAVAALTLLVSATAVAEPLKLWHAYRGGEEQ